MNPRFHTPGRKLSLIAIAVMAYGQPAQALDYIWQDREGQWLDASQWSLLGVPGGGDTATINHTGTGSVNLDTTRALDRLTMNGGRLGGAGTLNLNRLIFNGGSLGATVGGSGGTVNVAGNTSFNGSGTQSVAWSQTLNLNGDSSWTVGNGRIGVDGAYSAGNNSFPSAILQIASGSTFTDLGATSDSGYKILGGGSSNVVNNGTYNRNGLGTTWVRGLGNHGTLNVNAGTLAFEAGNWLNTSSGLLSIAKGAQVLLAATTFTAGAVNNAGKITVIGNDSHVQAGARISGDWQINAGSLFIEGSQRIGAMNLNGGMLTGQGTLTVDSLAFNAGTLSNPTFMTGARLNVQGEASFNGGANLRIANSAQLHLNGNSSWSVGNGRIGVDGAYSAGNNSFPSATLQIASGSTFTDLGAVDSNGFKLLRGGLVQNDGTLRRSGLGATEIDGLKNQGWVDVREGTLLVDGNFSNQGSVTVHAGAVLQGHGGPLRNEGLLSGDGTLRTLNLATPLLNAGVLTPGGVGTAGQLLLVGDLAMTDSGALRIDLEALSHDVLTITSDAGFAGTLQIWAAPALGLQLGDSFVVATYGQRLSGSTFGRIQWLGAGANPFSVEYGDQAITLRVTSAVPEPGSWVLLLGGLGWLAGRARRTRKQV